MTRTVYAIRECSGPLVAEHVRVQWPGGKKEMFWRLPGCDSRDGLGGLSVSDLPLYRSERIGRIPVGATVLVTEGEKSTDWLWSHGFFALGTVTGAWSTPGEDALSVLLPFDVVLWPDHDREGYQHMNRVAWALHRLVGQLPRYVAPVARMDDGRGMTYVIAPKGFDAADVVDSSSVRPLVDSAMTWDLHPEPERPKPVKLARPNYDRYDSEQRVEQAKASLYCVVEGKIGAPRKQDRRSAWWPCPFHSERTPSFKVDLVEPYYVCFGCGARGDVFTFLQAMEGVAFKDAIRELAPAIGLGGIPRLWG
jgi:hypothetical protein